MFSFGEIEVHKGLIEAVVFCGRETVIDARTAARLQGLMPHLADQVCVSAGNRRFGTEIIGTEAAHALEHVALELMALEAAACDDAQRRVYRGHTSFIRRDMGRETVAMRVALTFDNDLVALAALRQAAAIITWATASDDTSYDLDEAVNTLHALRRV